MILVMAKNEDPNESRAMRQSDHDLLIAVHEQVKGIREDMSKLTVGTAAQIADHETRLRRLEYSLALVTGLSVALQFYFNYIK